MKVGSLLGGKQKSSGANNSDTSGLIIQETQTEELIRQQFSLLKQSMKSAFIHWNEIGRLLLEKKATNEGSFHKWVSESNLGFDVRQAQKYMKVYQISQVGLMIGKNSKGINEGANSEFAFEETSLNQFLKKYSDRVQSKANSTKLPNPASSKSTKQTYEEERKNAYKTILKALEGNQKALGLLKKYWDK